MIILRLSQILYNAKNRVKSFFINEFFTEDFTVLTPFWDKNKLFSHWPPYPKIQKFGNPIGRHSLQWGECVCEWSKNYKIQNVEFIDFDVYSRLLVPQEKN